MYVFNIFESAGILIYFFLQLKYENWVIKHIPLNACPDIYCQFSPIYYFR